MSNKIRGSITREQADNSQANLKALQQELRMITERVVELSSTTQKLLTDLQEAEEIEAYRQTCAQDYARHRNKKALREEAQRNKRRGLEGWSGWRFVVPTQDGTPDTYQAVNTETPWCLVSSEVYDVIQKILDYFDAGSACLEDYCSDFEDYMDMVGSTVVGVDYASWDTMTLRFNSNGLHEFTLEGTVTIDCDFTPGHSDGELVREAVNECVVTWEGCVDGDNLEITDMRNNGLVDYTCSSGWL